MLPAAFQFPAAAPVVATPASAVLLSSQLLPTQILPAQTQGNAPSGYYADVAAVPQLESADQTASGSGILTTAGTYNDFSGIPLDISHSEYLDDGNPTAEDVANQSQSVSEDAAALVVAAAATDAAVHAEAEDEEELRDEAKEDPAATAGYGYRFGYVVGDRYEYAYAFWNGYGEGYLEMSSPHTMSTPTLAVTSNAARPSTTIAPTASTTTLPARTETASIQAKAINAPLILRTDIAPPLPNGFGAGLQRTALDFTNYTNSQNPVGSPQNEVRIDQKSLLPIQQVTLASVEVATEVLGESMVAAVSVGGVTPAVTSLPEVPTASPVMHSATHKVVPDQYKSLAKMEISPTHVSPIEMAAVEPVKPLSPTTDEGEVEKAAASAELKKTVPADGLILHHPLVHSHFIQMVEEIV